MSPRLSIEEQAKCNVKCLIDYAKKHLYLNSYDTVYTENILLDALKLTEPYSGEIKEYDFYKVMDELSSYAVKKGITDENSKLLFETKLIGICMPAPSKVVEMFDEMTAYKGIKAACDMLYKLSNDSAYIRRPDINKNIIWDYNSERGKIIVTINLSKPEKTPEQVRLAKEAKTGYPKCMLCKDVIGFSGNAAFPARQTIRTIPFELDGEDWFMQFSPYSYFDQHIIVISDEHRPMDITDGTFRRITDFLDMFPHYFIGSNAPLPIVGGSILAHDHYQGGNKVLPIFTRKNRKIFDVASCPDVKLSIVDWYNSVIRVESKNRDQLLETVNKVYKEWQVYSDKSQNIIAETKNGKEITPHNAITPLCVKNDDGNYQFNLILRNNRCDETHPFGIFHPAAELHNIKQEAIGIIEVAGLFILPGRLASECTLIKDILTGKAPLNFAEIAKEDNPLSKHLGMIMQLVNDNGTALDDAKAGQVITDYINSACEKILDTTAVFKNDEIGQKAFEKFISKVTE